MEAHHTDGGRERLAMEMKLQINAWRSMLRRSMLDHVQMKISRQRICEGCDLPGSTVGLRLQISGTGDEKKDAGSKNKSCGD
jgi:hypothetical protein